MSEATSEPAVLTLHIEDETMTAALAAEIAARAGAGDVIALKGPLGAGKTAFARAFLRALGETDEVPSPTFTLVQTYQPEAAPAPVHHFDFYRLEHADDAYELGIEDAFADGISLLEWPERIAGLLPADHLEVAIEVPVDAGADIAAGAEEGRVFELTGHGSWVARIRDLLETILANDDDENGGDEMADADHNPERLIQAVEFLGHAGWENVYLSPVAGDASFRRYFRVTGRDEATAILMDAPPEQEDVRPFVSMANHLLGLGLSAPEILAKDEAGGFLLLEDLGDATFTRELGRGTDETLLYEAAVDVLVHLHGLDTKVAVPPGLLPYGNGRLLDEMFLLPQWFVPAFADGDETSKPPGNPMSEDARKAYGEAWLSVFPRVHELAKTLVLRDYHVDNLIWLPERDGIRRTGLLDFQDAVSGAPAYDLMSLLEDARRDISPELKEAMLARYFAATGADQKTFMPAFHILAAGRHAKVIGIFTRLSVRDGKDVYLRHIPRVWRLLEASLAAEPALAPVRAWLDTYVPPSMRTMPPHRPPTGGRA